MYKTQKVGCVKLNKKYNTAMGQNPITLECMCIHMFCIVICYNHDQYPYVLSLITHSFMTLLMLPTTFLTTRPSVPVPGAVQHKMLYTWNEI